MDHLKAIGRPSTFVCPECKGALWEVDGVQPRRYRCHTGHGFTLRTLHHAQANGTDEAIWSALRALQEKEMLLRAMAEQASAEEAAELTRQAEEAGGHAETLRALVERVPPAVD